MIEMRGFRKKFFRTIFSISIIFIFSTDVVLPKNDTLKLVKDYLGDIRTLQARFSQSDYMGDIMTGDLFLKKFSVSFLFSFFQLILRFRKTKP